MKFFLHAFLLSCLLSANFSSSHAASITVSAASSLTNVMPDIATLFVKTYPQHQVAFNFGASGALLQQITKGAPVDVFLSADLETMELAQKQGLLGLRRNFAGNTLVLIMPSQSAMRPKQLADLAQPQYRHIAIGLASTVPAGHYAQQALQQAQIWPQVAEKMIATYSVRQALDYVVRAEVDAGFVFATDAAQFADKVRVVLICATEKKIIYPAAVLTASKQTQAAQQFVQFLLSASAQQILRQHGFTAVSE